jgi:hypothetical protein
MYGNTMTKGGERPSVSLVGPKGSRAQHSVVTQDFNDGSYGVTLTPDKPGSYKFTVSPLKHAHRRVRKQQPQRVCAHRFRLLWAQQRASLGLLPAVR